MTRSLIPAVLVRESFRCSLSSPISPMASATRPAEAPTEPEKNVWERSEQQFKSWETLPSLAHTKSLMLLEASADPSSSIPARISPMRVSNACTATMEIRICARTISSTFIGPEQGDLAGNIPTAVRTGCCPCTPHGLQCMNYSTNRLSHQGVPRLQEGMGPCCNDLQVKLQKLMALTNIKLDCPMERS